MTELEQVGVGEKDEGGWPLSVLYPVPSPPPSVHLRLNHCRHNRRGRSTSSPLVHGCELQLGHSPNPVAPFPF